MFPPLVTISLSASAFAIETKWKDCLQLNTESSDLVFNYIHLIKELQRKLSMSSNIVSQELALTDFLLSMIACTNKITNSFNYGLGMEDKEGTK